MGAEKTLVNVNKGQDAYSVIGNYILNHVTAIEDMIAVIQINGVIIKELYMVDVDADGYFCWKSDWWEGEEDVALLDFFPVSDAERIQEGEQDDLISRQAAIDAIADYLSKTTYTSAISFLNTGAMILARVPSAEPEIIRCKDCKHSEHWYRDRRRCFLWSEDGVSVFDDGFCNYAERRTGGNEKIQEKTHSN